MQALAVGAGKPDYVQVFIATPPLTPDWFILLIPVCALVVGVGMIACAREVRHQQNSWFQSIRGYFVTCIAILTLLPCLWTLQHPRPTLAQTLQRGQFKVVEGTVTNFSPMPRQGHTKESFEVDGHHYEYSDFILTGGFNHTSSHGGPIRNGLRVRIADVGGVIARLEVERRSRR
jgi:hypothetical protein